MPLYKVTYLPVRVVDGARRALLQKIVYVETDDAVESVIQKYDKDEINIQNVSEIAKTVLR